MKKFFVFLLKKLEFLDSVAVRLTVITGKSKYPVHPKHLANTNKPWFLNYINNSDVVLDLGCDNGLHTLQIAKKAKSVVGIDNAKRSLEIAKKFAFDQKIKNVRFDYGNLENKLGFKSLNFDKVVFLDVLEHVKNRQQILKEIYRILKKGGLLLLSIPNSETSWKKKLRSVGLNSFSDPDHKIEYSKKLATKVCQQAGFKILIINPVTYDTPLSPVIGLIGGFSLRLYKRLGDWKKSMVEKYPVESNGFNIVLQK